MEVLEEVLRLLPLDPLLSSRRMAPRLLSSRFTDRLEDRDLLGLFDTLPPLPRTDAVLLVDRCRPDERSGFPNDRCDEGFIESSRTEADLFLDRSLLGLVGIVRTEADLLVCVSLSGLFEPSNFDCLVLD